jgi:hypothetical protein
MAKLDARKLDHGTLEQIRIRAVQRVQAGEIPYYCITNFVATFFCLSRPRSKGIVIGT